MRSFYFDIMNKYLKNIIWIYFLFAIVWFYNEEQHLLSNESIEVSAVKEQEVYVSGRLIGIYEKADGVLVLDTETITDASGKDCCPAKGKVKAGDYIISINGETIHSKKQILKMLAGYKTSKTGLKEGKNSENTINSKEEMVQQKETIQLEVLRNCEKISTNIKPIRTKSGTYLMGIWIKDDMAGIGTMTYYTKDGEFGALGHGIGDGTTGELLSVSDGAIYHMELTGISKGKRGEPGELEGNIHYCKGNHYGTLQENGSLGIFGELDLEELETFSKEDQSFPVAKKQEIQRRREAYILSDVSGSMRSYRVEIESVNLYATDSNKGITIQVTDPELIALTGGIVQGLSGAPIIQDGKIIGAVTHVLVNDPTRGYGIFIENMLERNL